MWYGEVRCGVVWWGGSGMWCGEVRYGVVWCGVVLWQCSVVW